MLAGCSSASEGWVVRLSGFVSDEASGPIQSAEIEVFSATTGNSLGELTTGPEGEWSLPVFVDETVGQQNFPLRFEVSATGYAATEVHWAFSWLDDSWPSVPISLGPSQQVSLGEQSATGAVLSKTSVASSVFGSVYDVVTGEAVEGVELRIRSGWNAPLENEVVGTAISGVNGAFSIGTNSPGTYTVEAIATGGYARTLAPLQISEEASGEQVVLMSPLVGAGKARVALLWSDSARDLDLHVSGPKSGSAGRYQVYVEDSPHPVNGDPIAAVEFSGSQWESIGIYTLRSGEYRFSAYDRDFGIRTGSKALSGLAPTMLVWTENTSMMESLTPGSVGTIWRAVEFHSDTDSFFRLQELDEGREDSDLSAF